MRLHDVLMIAGAALGLSGLIATGLGIVSSDLDLALVGIRTLLYGFPVALIGLILLIINSVRGG